VHGLLLAAGAGRRMGTPKALVSDADGPWMPRAVATLRAGGCDRVTVVLGAEAELARRLVPVDVDVVVADDWAEGMGASLRTGLRSMTRSTTEAAVVSLVDLPDLVPAVVARVISAATPDRAAVLLRATYDARPGHPVVIGRDHWSGVIESAVGDQGAREYLASHDVTLVECGDLASGRDVDAR